MIKGALEFLRDAFDKASKPVDLTSELDIDDPREVIIAMGGKLERIQVNPGARHHHFSAIEDMVEFANRFPGTADGKTQYAGAVVWVGYNRINCHTDDSDRFDCATMELKYGSQFDALLMHKDGLDQFRFVRFLRHKLNMPEAKIAAFRRLDWNSNTSGEIAHGSSRMGKSVEAACAGTDQLPESMVVECPVYAYHGAPTHTIRCQVDVDTIEHRLRLVPEPEALEHAIEAAQAHLRETLKAGLADTIPVYRGTP